jgi:2-methylisocitrate lyase-like PEP mutase family enzyme
MDLTLQQHRAAAFRALHDRSGILVLPNAWDAASARIFEEAGFAAIGTTSAGIAYSLGYADEERVSREEMLQAVRRIAHAVKLPVSADVEAGYGRAPEEVARTVRGAVAAGAVGINLEDDTDSADGLLLDVGLQVERIQAAREAAEVAGVAALVVNARTDVYLAAIGEPADRFEHAVRRANAYRQAGADCLFVPGVSDGETIGRLARAIEGPLNVLAGPGVPPVPELSRLGVARVSVGSGAMRATLALVRRIAGELRGPGTYASLTADTIPYGEVQALLRGGPRAV